MKFNIFRAPEGQAGGGSAVAEPSTLSTAPIVGADIVELHPGRDVGDITAILGAKLVRELAALIDRNGSPPS